MEKIKLSELKLDFALFPRMTVDSQHVSEIAEAIRAGAELPPVIADANTLQVVDGFHRINAYRKVHGKNYELGVILKSYQNDGRLFEDAIRYNASHGRNLTSQDKVHCLIKAKKLELKPALIASALNITQERAETLVATKVGTLAGPNSNARKPVPLKRTIAHMAGKDLSEAQQMANKKLGGMNQLFYVNQIIILITHDLLDTSDESLMGRISQLAGLLPGLVAADHPDQ